MESLFELKPKQKAAFNRLKKAYLDCLRSGILFYNNYGTLSAVNGANFSKYDDEYSPDAIEDYGDNALYSIEIVNEWADDRHFVHLTELGKRLREEERELLEE